MKMFRRATFFTLLALTGLVAPHLHSQPLPERRALTGQLVGFNGAPVGGAEITVRRQNDIEAQVFWGTRVYSDARGQFSIPDAEEGSYYVSVDAEGYAPVQSKPFVLNESVSPLQLQLLRLTELKLRLLKTDGSPLANSFVSLRVSGDGSAGQSFPHPQTDGEGLITLPSLIPARYTLQILTNDGYAIVPQVEARPDIKPAPLEVRLKAGGTLHLTARDANGRGLGGASLYIAPVQDEARARAEGRLNNPLNADDTTLYIIQKQRATLITRDGDGLINLEDVAPGRYSLRVFLPGYEAPSPQTVEVKEGETTNLNFDFPTLSGATAPLEVTFQDQKGAPLADTILYLQLRLSANGAADATNAEMPPPPPGAPQGVPVEFFNGVLRRIQTDAQGKATIFPLRPGKWTVTASQPRDMENKTQLSFAPQTVTVSPQGATLTLKSNAPNSQ